MRNAELLEQQPPQRGSARYIGFSSIVWSYTSSSFALSKIISCLDRPVAS